ncbi:hypothetical protein L1987_21050 [Smallanthus sonchifolius]|uniref:Uncharacterized protein n=1 Tax=Smallanthus sonchifolius TaxID=185202 RepID=A0ACB9ISS8_9ASTR|nr:hypothetical protein L1987_21050 [Smallanthus sonchifolius]
MFANDPSIVHRRRYGRERLGIKRRYVKLYKWKLECIWKSEDFMVDSVIGIGANEANTPFDKLVDDDQSLSKPQGWLKWLSCGMLGAGGINDSSQFC